MGQKASWLKDERCIRIAGALLMISPFLNYIASVAFNSNLVDKWAFKEFVAGFILTNGFTWLGRITNFVVGFLMFRGKSSAWVPVLAVLGFAIAKSIITFKNYIHISTLQTVGSLLINVLLFLLVFESEYRINGELNKKIQAARESRTKGHLVEKTPATTPPPISKINPPAVRSKEFLITKGASIDFEGLGKFAEVIHCTDQELWVKATNHFPEDLHRRPVTLQAPGQRGRVRLKFSSLRDDSILVFRVIA